MPSLLISGFGVRVPDGAPPVTCSFCESGGGASSFSGPWYSGTSRGATTCNCILSTELLDSATREPLTDDWASSDWPVTLAQKASRDLAGTVWVPLPPKAGSYVVRLTVRQVKSVEDPSSVPANREVDGPFQIQEPDGSTVGQPYYQQLIPLATRDSDPFVVE